MRSFYGGDKPKAKSNEPSKDHWKPDSESQVCMDPKCGKEFNLFTRRKHHCRQCGCLFCQDCLFLERRLNLEAEPDHEGIPSRVCRGCFFDPPKPDELGNWISRTEKFIKKRNVVRKGTDEDTSKVQMMRVVKNLPGNDKWVLWESDDKVRACGCAGCSYCAIDKPNGPCGRSFKGVSEGKHHCRLCGKIFCHGCSRYRLALPSISDVIKYVPKKLEKPAEDSVVNGSAEDKEKEKEKGPKCASCSKIFNRFVLLTIAGKIYMYCHGCSRYRLTNPPIPISDVEKYVPVKQDGPHAAAGGSGTEAGADGGGKQLRSCATCFNNCNRFVLLPIAVYKGLEAVPKTSFLCLYEKACEHYDAFSKIIEEKIDSAEWGTRSVMLRQELQRTREFVERFGRMSIEPHTPGDASLIKSVEAYFVMTLREDLLPKFKRLQSTFEIVRASNEDTVQQQQHHDDEVQLGAGPTLSPQETSMAALASSSLLPRPSSSSSSSSSSSAAAAAAAISLPPRISSSAAAAAATTATSTPAAAAAAATSVPQFNPPPKNPKADRTLLSDLFGKRKSSLPSYTPSFAPSNRGRLTGPKPFNIKNFGAAAKVVEVEEVEQAGSGMVQTVAASQPTTMPAYLELRTLKGYADGFVEFLGSEGQFTADEFVQWCACDECPSPLQDPSHALAVGAAIVGQSFFEAVEGGHALKKFDDKSDSVWYFTGKWLGTPVHWAHTAVVADSASEELPSSPDVNPAPFSLLSSPTQRIRDALSLLPSPAKSSSSMDDGHVDGADDDRVDFFMSSSKVAQLNAAAVVTQTAPEKVAYSLPSFPADKEVPIIPPANTNMLQTLWFLSLCCDAIPTEMRSHSVLSADVSKAIVSAAQNASAQLRTVFAILSKSDSDSIGDDSAAVLLKHKDRAKESATIWQKGVSDTQDKWTRELTKRANSRFAQNFDHDGEMAAANQKALVQNANVALYIFRGMCDRIHVIPIHELPNKESKDALHTCVAALKILNVECESAVKFLRQQGRAGEAPTSAAEHPSRFTAVKSDLRQSVSSKFHTLMGKNH